MECGSQTFITSRVPAAEFEVSLANLESNLGVWIGNALREPELTAGLSLLCQKLERAILLGHISLPDRMSAVQMDHYARRLVYDDPSTGVSVLAMVWAPGQSTPLHDHSGLWVVEAVLAGEIETVPYHLIGHENSRYHFHPRSEER